MINPFQTRKLVNKLYGSLCPRCRAKLFRYVSDNKQKVGGQDFGGINDDMKNMPICDKCKDRMRESMKGAEIFGNVDKDN